MNLTVFEIKNRVYFFRGIQVLIDSDLAEFYQTRTKVLNQAVQRNLERFPKDFMFRLTEDENVLLKTQNPKSQHGGTRKLPNAFTNLGISMLSSILETERAVQTSILILRALTELNQRLLEKTEIFTRIDRIEQQNSDQYQNIVRLINQRPEIIQKPKMNSEFNQNKKLESDSIIQSVASYFGLRSKELLSPTRTQPNALSRQIAIYLIRKRQQLSYKEIGKIFNGKNHSTIMYAYSKIATSLETNEDIQLAVREIENSRSG